MGLVFMIALVFILVSGMTLVTADMYIGIIGVFHGRIGWGNFAWGLILAYAGNFMGSMFFMWIVSKGGAFAAWPWLAKSHAIGSAKMGYTATQIFAMGVICTWMLQVAAILFVKAKGDTAKIIVAALGPFAFVAGMAEHCIANIGFLALPLFQQDIFLTKAAAMGLAEPVILHWGFGQFGWAHNQLFTVLGNLVGGILFVGIPFQLVSNADRVRALYKEKTNFTLKI
jgi:formate/nitrite transporter FocA (FNT family)